jgi:hypothetical protein
MNCPVRPTMKLHAKESTKEWGTWLRSEQSRWKAFIPGGGEGDFRHSPTRYDTGGMVQPGGTGGGAGSEFSGTNQLGRGRFTREGRYDVESWSKGSETRAPTQLGRPSSSHAKSAKRLGREDSGGRGCLEKGNDLGCAVQLHMEMVGQTTHSLTIMGAPNCDAAVGTLLHSTMNVEDTGMVALKGIGGDKTNGTSCVEGGCQASSQLKVVG